MFKDTKAYSGFSVNDLATAEKFYGEMLGLNITQDSSGLTLNLAGGATVFVYQKDDHTPATYTMLNFAVSDISKVVEGLADKGITMERYNDMPVAQDDKGVLRGKETNMGPDIAWFKDPAGNVLAVMQE